MSTGWRRIWMTCRQTLPSRPRASASTSGRRPRCGVSERQQRRPRAAAEGRQYKNSATSSPEAFWFFSQNHQLFPLPTPTATTPFILSSCPALTMLSGVMAHITVLSPSPPHPSHRLLLLPPPPPLRLPPPKLPQNDWKEWWFSLLFLNEMVKVCEQQSSHPLQIIPPNQSAWRTTTPSISDTLTFSPRDLSPCSKKTLSTGQINLRPDLLITIVRLESLLPLLILNLSSSPFTPSRVFLSFKGERTPAIWTFFYGFFFYFPACFFCSCFSFLFSI